MITRDRPQLPGSEDKLLILKSKLLVTEAREGLSFFLDSGEKGDRRMEVGTGCGVRKRDGRGIEEAECSGTGGPPEP